MVRGNDSLVVLLVGLLYNCGGQSDVVNPLPGISGKGSTAPRPGESGHYLESKTLQWDFHCGTFSGIFTAEPSVGFSLRILRCGTFHAVALQ